MMRIPAVVLVLAATLGGLLHAGAAKETESAKKEPTVITALISSANTPTEQNAVLDAVLARTGIRFAPIVVPIADYDTKLSATIASKTVPHIINFGSADGASFIENGLLVKLNQLLDRHGPEILSNKGKYLTTALNGGGNIWAIPLSSGYPSNLALRSDWLGNLSRALPTDLDGFLDTMKAFTFNDPNRNGKNDTLGYGGSLQTGNWQNIFAAFGVPYGRPIMKNGIVTSHINHPNYLEAIRYWRKLYQAGVMEPDFATLPRMQCFEKLWGGIYGAFDFTAVGTTNNWLGRYKESPKPQFDFTILRGPGGTGGTLRVYETEYYGITVNCPAPDQAVKLCDFFTTKEGDELLYFGVEGKHYRWTNKDEGKFEYIPPYNDSATQRTAGCYVYWNRFRRHNDNAEIRTMNQITQKALKMGYDNPIADAFIYGVPAVEKELGKLLTDIEIECFVTLVVTSGNVEAEYQKFANRWYAEGGKTWEAQATMIYRKEHGN